MFNKILVVYYYITLLNWSNGQQWPFSPTENGINICFANNILEIDCECQEPTVDCSSSGKGINELNSSLALPTSATIVDFSRNNLNTVQKGILWPESVLEINLSRNNLTSLDIKVFSSGCANLNKLDLSRNKLMDIRPELFASFERLNTLDLSYNHLHAVDVQWFENTPTLMRLNLAYNPIGEKELPIECEMFNPLYWLEYLDLTNCSFRLLPLNIFQNNSRLTELSLARNPLDHVPTTQLIAAKDSLQFLDLTETDVRAIRNHEFHKLVNLRKLFLNSLRFLEKIEPLAFHDLHCLQVLQIKNNKHLKAISPFAFYDSMESEKPNVVKQLYLNNNGLNSLQKSLLNWQDSEVVQLDGNPWHCDCHVEWFTEKITSIDYNEYFVCYSPEAIKDIPVIEIAKDYFVCESRPQALVWVVSKGAVGVALLIFVGLCVTIIMWYLKPKCQEMLPSVKFPWWWPSSNTRMSNLQPMFSDVRGNNYELLQTCVDTAETQPVREQLTTTKAHPRQKEQPVLYEDAFDWDNSKL